LVLLINLPQVQTFTPLSLLCLAGMLTANGVECKVVDGNIEGYDAIVKEIKRDYPIVGLSCMTARRWDVFDTAVLIKELSPRSTVVIGGVHASLMPEQCKKYADVVIKGDGEAPLLDLCQGKEPKERVIPLDELPFPDYDKVNLKSYRGYAFRRNDFRKMNGIAIRKSPMVLIQASRSCTSHCRFCSSFYIQGKYRVKNPVRMADEIELLYNKGLVNFYFADDAFYLDKDLGIKFCQEIDRRKMKIVFHIQTRADAINDEYAYWLKRAGCYRVQVGLESGSDLILQKMHKSIDIETIHNGIKSCKKYGLYIQVCFILGNEGETDETIEETRKFLKRVNPEILSTAKHGLLLFPGTAVYREAVKEGMISEDFWDTRESLRSYKFPQEQIDKWIKRTHTYNFDSSIRYYFEKFLEWKNPIPEQA
jgi:anaerobic magnesium-protoporphyrin IX monomethyl ester cyclase